jgi:hypothetical protein
MPPPTRRLVMNLLDTLLATPAAARRDAARGGPGALPG